MDLTINSSYVTLLLNRLGRRSDTTLRTSVLDEMNMAKAQLEQGRFLPWFLLESLAGGVTTTASVGSIQVPTGFIREEEDSQLRLTDSEGAKSLLKKGTQDVLQEKYQNSAEAKPKYYSLVKDTLYFWPVPDATYTIHYWYYKQQPTLVDDGTAVTNPWLLYAADWLLATAGVQMASFHIQKADMAARFEKAIITARDNVMVQHEARKHTNMNYSDDSEYQTD